MGGILMRRLKLRLVARHAALTQHQAEQDWSLPSQKIMALLIDGQWAAALSLLESLPQQLDPMMRRLAADQGRLWNRISAAASLEEPEPAVFVWGGLALEARQNRQAAQDWLDRQPVDQASQDRLKVLVTLLDNPSTAETIGSSGTPTADAAGLRQKSGATSATPNALAGHHRAGSNRCLNLRGGGLVFSRGEPAYSGRGGAVVYR